MRHETFLHVFHPVLQVSYTLRESFAFKKKINAKLTVYV